MAIHFGLMDKVEGHIEAISQCFEYEGMDEESVFDLFAAYPHLHAAFDDSEEDVTVEKVNAAMRVEESLIKVEPEISDDPQLAELQKLMGISKRMAEDYSGLPVKLRLRERSRNA